MNEEILKNVINKQNQLEELNNKLNENRKVLNKKIEDLTTVFSKENEGLISAIGTSSEEIILGKEILRENAEVGFVKDSNKKRLGGIGIRIIKKLEYQETDAFNWAKEHNLALSLDKKRFEQIAKTEQIEFVKVKENILVTFPKKLSLD